MASPAHGLTTNGASPSTRQWTANTELNYPELRQARRCQLVVFGVEVGWRVSRGTLTFLRLLARARACQRAPWCAAAARQARSQRWKAQAALAAVRAHACLLLELPIAGPSDPSDDQEVPLGELQCRLGRRCTGTACGSPEKSVGEKKVARGQPANRLQPAGLVAGSPRYADPEDSRLPTRTHKGAKRKKSLLTVSSFLRLELALHCPAALRS